jgi:hypothetical protein
MRCSVLQIGLVMTSVIAINVDRCIAVMTGKLMEEQITY